MTWAHGLPQIGSVVLTGLFAAQMWVLFRQVGRFGIVDALLYPVHVAFLTVVTVVGLFRAHVLRRVRWRGRELAVAGSENGPSARGPR